MPEYKKQSHYDNKIMYSAFLYSDTLYTLYEVWSLQTILLILLSSAPHDSRFASRLAPDRLLLKIHLSG